MTPEEKIAEIKMRVGLQVIAAADKWNEENPDEDIYNNILTNLDKMGDQVIPKLLGFGDRWGRWELDHCNGRAGESAVGDRLRQLQGKAIDDWFQQMDLTKYLDDTVFQDILAKEIQDIRYKAARKIKARLEEEMNKRIERAMGEVDFDALLNEVSDLTDILKN